MSDPEPVERPLVMGVVNVTPDSFSDGGLFLDAERAIEHGRELAAEGADWVDVGGESTRPGAEEVPADEETRRTEPVVRALAGDGLRLSIDTSKIAVAEAALDAGAAMVNDVTAFAAEPELADLCAERGCEVVLMHMQGDPRTMQDDPTYDDVVDDVKESLARRLEFAKSQGIAEDRIRLDPGIGFGKTLEHNLVLLRRLGELTELGRPLVVGTSRKSFIGKITGREVDERLGGTIASCVLAYANGAQMLRVHDVAPVRDALLVAGAILGVREWRGSGAVR
jgi:dihydropteroate synthase